MNRLYALLGLVALAFALGWFIWSGTWFGDLAPNAITETLSILVTVAIVDRIVRHEEERHTKEEIGDRVRQALRRIRGGFFVLADFALYDYGDMHDSDTYKRPPESLPALLDHFAEGLKTSAALPEQPGVLTATTTLANYVEEQIQRHERVLDHNFVTAGWTFVREARMSERQYFAKFQRPPHLQADNRLRVERRRQVVALDTAVTAASRLYDVFEPYASEYLDEVAVALRPEDITDAKMLLSDAGPLG
jgi:hypothetical protein